jgi:hypothetical protein
MSRFRGRNLGQEKKETRQRETSRVKRQWDGGENTQL